MTYLEILLSMVVITVLFFILRKHLPIIITYTLDNPDAKKPTRSYHKAACFDVYATKSVTIPVNQWREIPIGVTFAAWPHWYFRFLGITFTPLGNIAAKIHTRSGHAIKKGLRAHLGIIDNDYRRTWTISMTNHNQEYPILMKKGDRVAQIEWYRVPTIWYFQVKKLSKSHRDKKGFGSSGR